LFAAPHRSLDDVFDGLADFVDRRFAPGVLMDLAELRSPRPSAGEG
jgi:adenosylcobyric acid synthase